MPEHASRTKPSGHRPASARSRRPRPARATRPAASAVTRPPSALEQAIATALLAPEPAATTFAELGLPGPLVTALAGQGITGPFAIQARALPDALAGRDVLGRAQTGSGKTLAFGLPMLARLGGRAGARRPHAPRGLVLVPTRELAKQVSEVLRPLGRPLGVTVTTVYGGASMGRQIEALAAGVDIVVATPGRLIDLMERGSCRLDLIEIAVLDEADHMSDLGFYPAVRRILEQTPDGGQRLLFSATLDRDVDRLVTEFLPEPAVHAIAPAADAATAAEHRVFLLPAADKVAIAAEIAARPARTLFFVRTKHGAARLATQLSKAGAPAAAIHGNLNQGQRQRALDAFAAGHPRVLVATDVAARGLHVDDVDLVVHYDPPGDHKDYLHRSGRTARAGASGTVLAFVDPAQVRDVARLHDAAGVTPTRHEVVPGHEAVREIAVSGEPVPPPPPPRLPRQSPGQRPARPSRRRPDAPAASPWPAGAGRDAGRRDVDEEAPGRRPGAGRTGYGPASRRAGAGWERPDRARSSGAGWERPAPDARRPDAGSESSGRLSSRADFDGTSPGRPARRPGAARQAGSDAGWRPGGDGGRSATTWSSGRDGGRPTALRRGGEDTRGAGPSRRAAADLDGVRPAGPRGRRAAGQGGARAAGPGSKRAAGQGGNRASAGTPRAQRPR